MTSAATVNGKRLNGLDGNNTQKRCPERVTIKRRLRGNALRENHNPTITRIEAEVTGHQTAIRKRTAEQSRRREADAQQQRNGAYPFHVVVL